MRIAWNRTDGAARQFFASGKELNAQGIKTLVVTVASSAMTIADDIIKDQYSLGTAF